MRRVIVLAIGLLLVGAGAAYTAGSPNSKLAAEDRVWGGGQFGPGCSLDGSLCISDPRNFAVDAHAQNDGSAAVGNSAYGGQTSRTVTCVRVQGNTAVIGGVITAGAALGAGYVQYFVDQGTTSLASPAHDLASASIIGPLDDPAWPAGFPDVCPPATGTANLPAAYFQVAAGDVNVQAAAN